MRFPVVELDFFVMEADMVDHAEWKTAEDICCYFDVAEEKIGRQYGYKDMTISLTKPIFTSSTKLSILL